MRPFTGIVCAAPPVASTGMATLYPRTFSRISSKTVSGNPGSQRRGHAHFARDEAHDFEIRLGAHGVEARFSRCTSPARLVTVPFFSYARGGRQHHVGLLRRLGEEHILHHEEIRLARRRRLFKGLAPTTQSTSRLRAEHLRRRACPPSAGLVAGQQLRHQAHIHRAARIGIIHQADDTSPEFRAIRRIPPVCGLRRPDRSRRTG